MSHFPFFWIHYQGTKNGFYETPIMNFKPQCSTVIWRWTKVDLTMIRYSIFSGKLRQSGRLEHPAGYVVLRNFEFSVVARRTFDWRPTIQRPDSEWFRRQKCFGRLLAYTILEATINSQHAVLRGRYSTISQSLLSRRDRYIRDGSKIA